jgi:hypothetical protein
MVLSAPLETIQVTNLCQVMMDFPSSFLGIFSRQKNCCGHGVFMTHSSSTADFMNVKFGPNYY